MPETPRITGSTHTLSTNQSDHTNKASAIWNELRHGPQETQGLILGINQLFEQIEQVTFHAHPLTNYGRSGINELPPCVHLIIALLQHSQTQESLINNSDIQTFRNNLDDYTEEFSQTGDIEKLKQMLAELLTALFLALKNSTNARNQQQKQTKNTDTPKVYVKPLTSKGKDDDNHKKKIVQDDDQTLRIQDLQQNTRPFLNTEDLFEQQQETDINQGKVDSNYETGAFATHSDGTLTIQLKDGSIIKLNQNNMLQKLIGLLNNSQYFPGV